MVVETTRSEDTMILFTLSPNVLNLDSVIKEIDRFCKKKQQLDTTDRFNFCAFVSNGPVYYEDFLFEADYIASALHDCKNQLATPNLAGGIMVAITFLIDVFKIVSSKCFRLIILTDKGTPPLANLEVVQALVDQVLEFPLFIDFIRIGTDNPAEDLKLMKFSKRNNGGVYFAKSDRELTKIFDTLLEKKKIPKSNSESQQEISPENEPFFNNLAQDPWIVEDSEAANKVCQICRSSSGNELVKCPKCGTITHPICLAQWAKMSNIGLPYVFRCMNCFNLLRMPKDYVLDIQSGAYKKRIQVQAANQTEVLRQRERSITPHLKQTVDPLGGMDMISYPNESSTSDASDSQGWADNDAEFVFKNDDALQIKFCDKCGAMNMPEVMKCSKCGSKLK